MAIYIFKTVHGVCQRNVQEDLHFLQLSWVKADYGCLSCFVLPFCSVALITI